MALLLLLAFSSIFNGKGPTNRCMTTVSHVTPMLPLTAIYLFLSVHFVRVEGMAAEGLDFVVSPEPAYFTVHPRSDVVLEGTTVTLRCSARVVDIGGFRRPLHTDTVPWRRYEIDWEFMPASKRDAGVPAANMHFTAAEKDVNLEVVNYRDTQGMTLNSTLTISGSMLSNSGAYRCAVQDWELKYTSYHGLIQIIPRGIITARVLWLFMLSCIKCGRAVFLRFFH